MSHPYNNTHFNNQLQSLDPLTKLSTSISVPSGYHNYGSNNNNNNNKGVKLPSVSSLTGLSLDRPSKSSTPRIPPLSELSSSLSNTSGGIKKPSNRSQSAGQLPSQNLTNSSYRMYDPIRSHSEPFAKANNAKSIIQTQATPNQSIKLPVLPQLVSQQHQPAVTNYNHHHHHHVQNDVQVATPISMPPPATSASAHTTFSPPLVRTVALERRQEEEFDDLTRMTGNMGNDSPRVPVYLASQGAKLEIFGDLDIMTSNWTPKEIHQKRRIVRFNRMQVGTAIRVSFEPIDVDEYDSSMTCISCIYWEELSQFYVTSVDTIHLLEKLIDSKFSVEEKNRIRRNLQGFKPLTVSKAQARGFFRLIMGFGTPKPRNIEKDVKVFLWHKLADALKKVISRYSGDYSSLANLNNSGHGMMLSNQYKSPTQDQTCSQTYYSPQQQQPPYQYGYDYRPEPQVKLVQQSYPHLSHHSSISNMGGYQKQSITQSHYHHQSVMPEYHKGYNQRDSLPQMQHLVPSSHTINGYNGRQ